MVRNIKNIKKDKTDVRTRIRPKIVYGPVLADKLLEVLPEYGSKGMTVKELHIMFPTHDKSYIGSRLWQLSKGGYVEHYWNQGEDRTWTKSAEA